MLSMLFILFNNASDVGHPYTEAAAVSGEMPTVPISTTNEVIDITPTPMPSSGNQVSVQKVSLPQPISRGNLRLISQPANKFTGNFFMSDWYTLKEHNIQNNVRGDKVIKLAGANVDLSKLILDKYTSPKQNTLKIRFQMANHINHSNYFYLPEDMTVGTLKEILASEFNEMRGFVWDSVEKQWVYAPESTPN